MNWSGCLRVLTPAADAPGPVDLVIENTNGRWEEAAGFIYLAAESEEFAVHGVAPGRVPTEGEYRFVGGTGFYEQTRVQIDGVPVLTPA